MKWPNVTLIRYVSTFIDGHLGHLDSKGDDPSHLRWSRAIEQWLTLHSLVVVYYAVGLHIADSYTVCSDYRI